FPYTTLFRSSASFVKVPHVSPFPIKVPRPDPSPLPLISCQPSPSYTRTSLPSPRQPSSPSPSPLRLIISLRVPTLDSHRCRHRHRRKLHRQTQRRHHPRRHRLTEVGRAPRRDAPPGRVRACSSRTTTMTAPTSHTPPARGAAGLHT